MKKRLEKDRRRKTRRNMVGFTFRILDICPYLKLPRWLHWYTWSGRLLSKKTRAQAMSRPSSPHPKSFHLAFWISTHSSLFILQWPLYTSISTSSWSAKCFPTAYISFSVIVPWDLVVSSFSGSFRMKIANARYKATIWRSTRWRSLLTPEYGVICKCSGLS